MFTYNFFYMYYNNFEATVARTMGQYIFLPHLSLTTRIRTTSNENFSYIPLMKQVVNHIAGQDERVSPANLKCSSHIHYQSLAICCYLYIYQTFNITVSYYKIIRINISICDDMCLLTQAIEVGVVLYTPMQCYFFMPYNAIQARGIHSRRTQVHLVISITLQRSSFPVRSHI